MQKASLATQEPIAWRGGIIAHFCKGEGQVSDPNAHREIVLGSSVGKVYHKGVRSHLAGATTQALRSTQMGG
eukprot:12860290-Alexandrium_andersonii.AAC.1